SRPSAGLWSRPSARAFGDTPGGTADPARGTVAGTRAGASIRTAWGRARWRGRNHAARARIARAVQGPLPDGPATVGRPPWLQVLSRRARGSPRGPRAPAA